MATIFDLADEVGRLVLGTSGENNTLYGYGGNDTLSGAGLIDVVFGGTGSDRIQTSTGADRVWFEHDLFGISNFGTDRWVDFSTAQGDKVDVSDAGETAGSNGSLGIGEFETVKTMLSTVYYSGGSYVQLRWGSSVLALEGVSSVSGLGAANFAFGLTKFADVLILGSQADIVATNLGADYLDGGSGNDTLFGEQDDDIVLGGLGADAVYGGSGNDEVWGDAGNDTLYGGSGSDTLVAGGGFDLAYGGDGADHFKMEHAALSGTWNTGARWVDFTLAQGDKVDVSYLGGNDSSLYHIGVGELDTILAMDAALAGGGRSVIWGGSRLDLPSVSALTAAMFRFSTSVRADSISLNNSANLIAVAGGNDTLLGNAGNDTLFGEQGDDDLFGGIGLDQLYGGTGRDELLGGVADDQLFGGAGHDTLDGGAGGDRMVGGDGDDVYLVNQTRYPLDPFTTYDAVVEGVDGGIDLVRVSSNEYTLGANIENAETAAVTAGSYMGFGLPIILTGNGLDNQLTGSATKGGVQQILQGGAGKDRISGLGGIDMVFGEAGNDMVDGGSGDDFVFGGRGADLISGGKGRDFLNGDDDMDVIDDKITRVSIQTEDRFLFDERAGAANADKIGDFDSRDFILLDKTVFTSLNGTSGRAIAAGNFVLGTAAQDGNDFVIYDQTTGALWYDADGNGSGAKALVAHIYKGTTYDLVQVPPSFTSPNGIEVVVRNLAATSLSNLDILLF